jgi:hypothetical protein
MTLIEFVTQNIWWLASIMLCAFGFIAREWLNTCSAHHAHHCNCDR